MSEELVNRLRDTNGGWASDEALAAADRIEALEAENARLREALTDIGYMRVHSDVFPRIARAALQDKGKQND